VGDVDALRGVLTERSADRATMLPALAYTSPEVLGWELRHVFAGTWTCLGRLDQLLPQALQRAVAVGDVPGLLVRDGERVRLFANTCRHRGHELLAPGGEEPGAGVTSGHRSVVCPYHAWSYRLDGSLLAAPGFQQVDGFDAVDHALAELPVEVWGGWVFGHGVHPLGDGEAPSFEEHLGALRGVVEPYQPERLVPAARHTYEIAANWKVIAENYHECYHCPLIHPELCRVSPPTSGDNYDRGSRPQRWSTSTCCPTCWCRPTRTT
jgi:glycine betaine catabolism A